MDGGIFGEKAAPLPFVGYKLRLVWLSMNPDLRGDRCLVVSPDFLLSMNFKVKEFT
jgi:hypothetical protein